MNVNYQPVPHSAFRVPHSTSRRGVTLLFVISMIVLFLLMGTTFVVVSNDYLRASRRRNVSGGVNSGAVTREQGHQLVVQSFLNAIRGPSLDDTQNPLRGHDLLGDMYGYGIQARLNPDTNADFAPNVHASNHFLTFSIRLNNAGTPPLTATSLLSGEQLESLLTHDTGLVTAPLIPPGHFNGRLITITSGDAAGLTCRVIQSNGVSNGIGDETHTFVVYPLNPASDLATLVQELAGGVQVIINGRPFAGTGTGQFAVDADSETPAFAASSAQGRPAVLPNVVGQNRDLLVGRRFDESNPARPRIAAQPRDGLLSQFRIDPATGMRETDATGTFDLLFPNPSATSEPWDAVDFQNMMLAGIVFSPINGNRITPSFFRNGFTLSLIHI